MTAFKHQVAGAIIAGGHSRRFGSEKASANLAGKHLVEHVYQRLVPQVSKVWLNAHRESVFVDTLGVDYIEDANEERNGPLAGVLAALKAASKENFEWLLISPCDTPLIPLDLTEKLITKCHEQQCQLAIASSAGWKHPSLSLWNCSLLGALEDAVFNQEKAGFKQFYPEATHCFVEWSVDEYDPFFNINYPQDLEAAADIINNNPDLKPLI